MMKSFNNIPFDIDLDLDIDLIDDITDEDYLSWGFSKTHIRTSNRHVRRRPVIISKFRPVNVHRDRYKARKMCAAYDYEEEALLDAFERLDDYLASIGWPYIQ